MPLAQVSLCPEAGLAGSAGWHFRSFSRKRQLVYDVTTGLVETIVQP